MDAKVTWHGRLTFTATADTGYTVPLGADLNAGGDDDGFRPIELFVVGLAGCTAMDVISILQKKRQDVVDFEVEVHAKGAADHPKVITRAVVEYFVTGHSIDQAALVRAIELSAIHYCPAQAMLNKIMPIELKYNIFEAGEDGVRNLVKSGAYAVAAKDLSF